MKNRLCVYMVTMFVILCFFKPQAEAHGQSGVQSAPPIVIASITNNVIVFYKSISGTISQQASLPTDFSLNAATSPAWLIPDIQLFAASPNGRYIAFSATDSVADYALFIFDLTDASLEQVSIPFFMVPVWSPDSSGIKLNPAFLYDYITELDIISPQRYFYNLTNSQLVLITQTLSDIPFRAPWLPDSSGYFFSRGTELLIVDRDGTNFRRLGPDLANFSSMRVCRETWLPATSTFYVAANCSAPESLVSVDNNGNADFVFDVNQLLGSVTTNQIIMTDTYQDDLVIAHYTIRGGIPGENWYLSRITEQGIDTLISYSHDSSNANLFAASISPSETYISMTGYSGQSPIVSRIFSISSGNEVSVIDLGSDHVCKSRWLDDTRLVYERTDESCYPVEDMLTGNLYLHDVLSGVDTLITSDPGWIVPTTEIPVVSDSSMSADSFTLVNADTDSTLYELTDDMIISLDQPPINGARITVQAETSGTVGSVVFDLDDVPAYRMENTAPYTVAGVSGGDYLPWTIDPGMHTLTATPFSGPNGTGTAGIPLTITFTLVESSVSCDTTVTASDVSGLVSAINTANGSGGADTICLEASTYTLNAVQNNNYGPNGLPAITSEITLVGLGGGATIERADGSPSFRFFRITSGGTLTLDNLTLSGGNESNGGAIYNEGSLTLTNSTLQNNSAGRGGAIRSDSGTVTLTDSTISGNTASSEGGGIYSVGTLALNNSDVLNNTAPNGAGLFNNGGAVTLDGRQCHALSSPLIFAYIRCVVQ